LRVAIDATPLTVPTGGIRRYVVELTRALALQFPEDDYLLLSDQGGWRLPDEIAPLANVSAPLPPALGWRRKWWSLGLPWALIRENVDVFHGSDFSIPYLPLKPTVLMIHDLSPWKPGELAPGGSERIRSRTRHLAHLATMVVTPSEAIRRETSAYFGRPSSAIAVTPLAACEGMAAVSESVVAPQLEKLGIGGPYALYLGSLMKRKNVPRLIEAWRLARTQIPGLSLVVAGAAGDLDISLKTEPGLHILGPLSDNAAAGLLSGAAVFVYPSFYEGFGLPVLEAMRAGTPVITSKDPALMEVAGGAALPVDAKSLSEISSAIVAIVNRPGLRERLQAKGRHRASCYSWQSTAVRTHAAYAEAIRRF
jgi:glycosyltransferase involved in cell wall biosynthesis